MKTNLFKKDSKKEDGQSDSDVQLSWPVFLNRNKRKMKQVRKHLVLTENVAKTKADGVLEIENGLVIR